LGNRFEEKYVLNKRQVHSRLQSVNKPGTRNQRLKTENHSEEKINLDSKELAHLVAQLSLEKKAEDVLILDLRGVTTITDYFVICSGDTDIQVKAISDNIIDELSEQKIKVWHREGYESLNWVLLDLVDVVVHVFRPETRDFYNLEKLWGDAEITKIEDK